MTPHETAAAVQDTDLPPAAIYLPTETGEGATLVQLTRDLQDDLSDDYLGALVDWAGRRLSDADCGDYAPVLVWPKFEGFDDSWSCQASGEELAVDEVNEVTTKDELLRTLECWVQASY